MNNDRRKRLQTIISTLEQARADLDDIKSEEQDYFDAMPEAFQQADKGQAAEAAIEEMENAGNSDLASAIDGFDRLTEQLDEIVQSLETAEANRFRSHVRCSVYQEPQNVSSA